MKMLHYVILGTLLAVNNAAASQTCLPDGVGAATPPSSERFLTDPRTRPSKEKPALVRRFGLRGPRRGSSRRSEAATDIGVTFS